MGQVYPPTPGNGVEDDDIEDDKGSSSNEEQVMSDIASGLNPSWESQITSASNYSPGGDQAIADFYTSQQLSTSGSRSSQCKQGTPSLDDLEHLASELECDIWKPLGRRLGIKEAKLSELDESHRRLPEKGFQLLRH